MKPRILVIGLDAATMDLITPWVSEGRLPSIAAIMTRGSAGTLLSTPNMHSASAWTSIITGLNPGRHGLFVFSDRDFATDAQVFFTGGDRTGETLWTHLARNGLTSGFLNVPMTYPAAAPAGGFMVSGLDAPSLNERAFHPASLRDEVRARFPDYRFTPPDLSDVMRAGRLDDAIARWLELTENQTRVAEYLLESRPVDFFMTVFTASDWAGHNLWEHRAIETGDPTPAGREPWAALLRVYRALDRAVGKLVDLVGESVQVYVLSDHGMGRHSGASYHIASWLESKGYLRRRVDRGRGVSMASLAKRIAGLVPPGMRELLKATMGEDRVREIQTTDKDSFYSSIDWERTTAYSEPGRHVVNINLAGRNKHGIVPAAEYADLIERIRLDLTTWEDPRGEPVVRRVIPRSEAYSGPFADRASDLYIEWNSAASLGPPPEEVRARGFWWSGDHRPEGVLIAAGPGIGRDGELKDATVYDVVPTVLYLSGLSVPSNLDGRVLREICAAEFLESHPLRIDASSAAQRGSTSDLTTEEEKLVEEKLRGLGYM
jgi:predicted AlkP superfamily phosphohydrolase/phosphomutase